MDTSPIDDDPYVRNRIWVGGERATGPDGLPSGVTVTFHERSTGNTVHLAPNGRFKNVVVNLTAAIDCRVVIGALRVHFGGVQVSFVLNSGRCSTGAFVEIGDGCVFNGPTHIIGPLTAGIGVSIGKNGLFASGVSIRASSHHGLWDVATGDLLNPEVGIIVEEHVWLGNQVILLHKAVVPSGSVVAARSVVNKAFSETNSLLAGAPAAIRRSGVEWTHEFPVDNGLKSRPL